MNNAVNTGESEGCMARKTIYLGTKLLTLAQKRAAADGRSLSNYIVQLIRRDVDVPESTPNGNGHAAPGEEAA